MQSEQLFSKSIGSSCGLGFLTALGLVSAFTSGFALWSLSCLGSATVEVASRLMV